jgi:hypothetical protein
VELVEDVVVISVVIARASDVTVGVSDVVVEVPTKIILLFVVINERKYQTTV